MPIIIGTPLDAVMNFPLRDFGQVMALVHGGKSLSMGHATKYHPSSAHSQCNPLAAPRERPSVTILNTNWSKVDFVISVVRR